MLSRNEMDNILQLVGLEGGEGSTYWKIVAELEQGTAEYFPAVDENGNEVKWSDWEGSIEDYFKHKVKKHRLMVRYLVSGNPIAAESEISEMLGCLCMSVAPNTLDVYYSTDSEY